MSGLLTIMLAGRCGGDVGTVGVVVAATPASPDGRGLGWHIVVTKMRDAMSGTHITDQQVRLYMNKRKQHSQETAAAMAGFSERTARRIERGIHQPSHNLPRTWRTRPDPFADVWENELVPLLKHSPKLKAITLLDKLQEAYPGRFPFSMRRTLERRVSQWRAQQGPEKEIFFPQEHLPGMRGLSDFTDMGKLGVSIAGVPFDHRLYHFVLAFSLGVRLCYRRRREL